MPVAGFTYCGAAMDAAEDALEVSTFWSFSKTNSWNSKLETGTVRGLPGISLEANGSTQVADWAGGRCGQRWATY